MRYTGVIERVSIGFRGPLALVCGLAGMILQKLFLKNLSLSLVSAHINQEQMRQRALYLLFIL